MYTDCMHLAQFKLLCARIQFARVCVLQYTYRNRQNFFYNFGCLGIGSDSKLLPLFIFFSFHQICTTCHFSSLFGTHVNTNLAFCNCTDSNLKLFRLPCPGLSMLLLRLPDLLLESNVVGYWPWLVILECVSPLLTDILAACRAAIFTVVTDRKNCPKTGNKDCSDIGAKLPYLVSVAMIVLPSLQTSPCRSQQRQRVVLSVL